MPSPAASTVAPSAGHDAVGTGRLALAFQEVLTAVVRLRAQRQPVTDGAAFRGQMTALLQRADAEARAAGYAPEDARLGAFAVVALLDESALNSPQPALASWARRPLQDELFGEHLAGERFFQHLDALLARPDSPPLADVLEVFGLALLLGFRGRYAIDTGALPAIAARVGERVQRVRQSSGAHAARARGDLVTGWRPPDDAVAGRDPWLRRLTTALVACLALAVLLWGAGQLSLASARDDLREMAPASAPAPSTT
jgi:type VI secretion system protein ImpK